MNIVFASHSAFDPNLVVGSHHLSRQCARLGHHVLHLSSPITPAHIAKYGDPRVRERIHRCLDGPVQLETNLWEWIPFTWVPWQVAARGDLSANNRFVPTISSLRKAMRNANVESIDQLWIDEPRLVGIDSVLQPKRMAYRATDLYAEMKQDPTIHVAERILCNRAHLRVGTSMPVVKHLEALAGRPVLQLENGVDVEHFQIATNAHDSLQSSRRPRVVYVGAVDDRFDLPLVMFLAVTNPTVEFLIYGPLAIPQPIEPPPNLRLMGALPYEKLPSVLQHCDVGMLPLNDHPANRARSPMKFYEYAAAGLPILSRRTAEIDNRKDLKAAIYDTPDEANSQLLKLIEGGRVVTDVQSQSWAGKTTLLLNALDQAN